MKKLIITLLSALCMPIFAETNAPIVLTEELVPYALNTNVVHASYNNDLGYQINDTININNQFFVTDVNSHFGFWEDGGPWLQIDTKYKNKVQENDFVVSGIYYNYFGDFNRDSSDTNYYSGVLYYPLKNGNHTIATTDDLPNKPAELDSNYITNSFGFNYMLIYNNNHYTNYYRAYVPQLSKYFYNSGNSFELLKNHGGNEIYEYPVSSSSIIPPNIMLFADSTWNRTNIINDICPGYSITTEGESPYLDVNYGLLGIYFGGSDEYDEYVYNYLFPTNRSTKYLTLTDNADGTPDIDLSTYALNTNVVHASYSDYNYTLNDGSGITVGGLDVLDPGYARISLRFDEGIIFNNDGDYNTMTLYPFIEVGNNTSFLFGRGSNDHYFELYMPSDSNGKYLALTTNNTGHITYDEIAGTPDIDTSNLVLKSDIYNTIPLSIENESRGVNFIDSDGDIDQNVAITIGKDAVAGLSDTTPDIVPDNTTLRSTGIAIGAYAKANGTTSNGRRNQGIAIGFNADASGMSSVAIGSGSVHGSETSLTGSNAYSLGEGSVSLGYNSKSLDQWSVALGSYSYASNYWSIALGYLATASATSSVALGPTAKANARGAVQIGNGTNTEEFSLKFRDTTIVRDGKIVGPNVINDTNTSGVVLGYYLEGNSNKIFQPKGNYVTTNYVGDVSIKGRFAGGQSTAKGDLSHSEGLNTTANGYGSHAEGRGTSTGSSAGYSHAEGNYTQANGGYSHSDGTYSKATHILSWVWQGGTSGNTAMDYYESKGPGTFNINPVGGTDGFYIGETNLTDHIKNISTSVMPPKVGKQVAMFIIPVNDDVTWNIFTDFELKATTNNFDDSVSESSRLQYYAQSEIANIGSSTGTSIDKMWLFTETSNMSGDSRKYKYITNTINYTNILNSVVVLVDITCLKRHNENNGEWLSDDNEEIVWCYCRYKSTAGDKTPEYEYGTNNQLWRPIAPVKWFSKMPSWASSQIQ